MNIERMLFEALRGQAIDAVPSEFTTADYIEAICRQHPDETIHEGPSVELAQSQLSDCQQVIRIGENEWQKIQLTPTPEQNAANASDLLAEAAGPEPMTGPGESAANPLLVMPEDVPYGAWFKCGDCGTVGRSTLTFDCYGELGEPLRCECCMQRKSLETQ